MSWHRKDTVRVATLLVCLALIGGLYAFLESHGLLGRRLIVVMQTWARQAGWLGPLIILAVFSVQTIIPLPNILLAAATGSLYGPWVGSLLVILGWLLSATVSFCAGRYFGRHWFETHASAWLKEYADLLHERGFVTVVFMRLVQVPADVVGILCGMTRLSYREYMLATFFGILPGAITFTVLGRAWTNPRTLILFAAIFFASMGLAVWFKRSRWFKRV